MRPQVVCLQAQAKKLAPQKTRQKKLPRVTPEEEVQILRRRVQKAERDERMDLSNMIIEPKTYMGGFTRPRDLRASNWFPGGPYVLKGKRYESPSEEAYKPHTVFLLETRHKVRHSTGIVDSKDHVIGVCRAVDWPRLIKFYNSPNCPAKHKESLDNACWSWLPRSGKVIRPVVWWGQDEKLEDIMKEIHEDPNYVSPYFQLLRKEARQEVEEVDPPPRQTKKPKIDSPNVRVSNRIYDKEEIRRQYYPIIKDEPFWRPLLAVTFSTRPLALTLSRLSKALPRGLPFYASMSNDDRKCLYSFTHRMTSLRLDRMRSLVLTICSRLSGENGGFVGIRFSTDTRGRGIDGEGLGDPIPRDQRLVKVMIGDWFYRAADEQELYRLGAEEHGGDEALEVSLMNDWGRELDAQGNELPLPMQESSSEDSIEFAEDFEDEKETENENEEDVEGMEGDESDEAMEDIDEEDLLQNPRLEAPLSRRKLKPILRENTEAAARLRRKLAYRLGGTHRSVLRIT